MIKIDTFVSERRSIVVLFMHVLKRKNHMEKYGFHKIYFHIIKHIQIL